jgi:hypothetical protein
MARDSLFQKMFPLHFAGVSVVLLKYYRDMFQGGRDGG